jgi:spore coat protein U-like protein
MVPTSTSRVPGHAAAILALALLGVACAARADAGCTVSGGGSVAFGTYNVFTASADDSTGQFSWRCDFFTFPSVRITLTHGTGSTTFRPRRMTSATDSIEYNLFLDTARTNIWGDESEGTAAYYGRYKGSGNMQVYIYGRIPASQDVSVGTYSDTVTVVINF